MDPDHCSYPNRTRNTRGYQQNRSRHPFGRGFFQQGGAPRYRPRFPLTFTTSTQQNNFTPSYGNQLPSSRPTFTRRRSRRRPPNNRAGNHNLPLVKQESPAYTTEPLELATESLREKLSNQLRAGSYCCVICLSAIDPNASVWSCHTCYHVYHLDCIASWARRSLAASNNSDEGWNCPSCQTRHHEDALTYWCFCRKLHNPSYHPARNSIPHGCDEVCAQLRPPAITSFDNSVACRHPCTILCHPGPCPPCSARVTASCPCGSRSETVLCGTVGPQPCGQLCRRALSSSTDTDSFCGLGLHSCLTSCHFGPCPPCRWYFRVACYCGEEQLTLSCGNRLDMNKLDVTPDVLKQALAGLDAWTSQLPDMFDAPPVIVQEKASRGLSPLHESDQLAALTLTDNPPALDDHRSDNAPVESSSDDPVNFQPPCHEASEEDGDEASDSINDNVTDETVGQLLVHLTASFSCQRECGRLLTCSQHTCPNPCHSGPCKPCSLDPLRCLACPCGRVALAKLVPSGDPFGDRKTCRDPFPVCTNLCNRPHAVCGHSCIDNCHQGPCPPCKLTTTVHCRCSRTSREMPCDQLTRQVDAQNEWNFQCEKGCKKMKSCGRHKCNNKCCNSTEQDDHRCLETCGRLLACREHRCEEPCHAGQCGTCWRGVIYQDLACECGFTVLMAPLPCGTIPPMCSQPCSRPHSCDHPVKHPCHNEPSCPPCATLVVKKCAGGHGVELNVPCFQDLTSCGQPCNRPFATCSHSCQRPCHAGACNATNRPCQQPCNRKRPDCDHYCSHSCHEASGLTCAQIGGGNKQKKGKGQNVKMPPCQTLVDLTCSCGRRKGQLLCYEVENRRLALLLQQGEDSSSTKPQVFLPCDQLCHLLADEGQASLDLSRCADTSTWQRAGVMALKPLPDPLPEYSDSLKSFAMANLAFVVSVERQLSDMLSQLAKTDSSSANDSSSRTIAYHFPPMNKKRRLFILELAEFYNMQAFTFDPGPNRHVMILAIRDNSQFPANDQRATLSNCLRREFPSRINLTSTQSQSSSSTVPITSDKPPSVAGEKPAVATTTSTKPASSFTTPGLSFADVLARK